MPTYSVLYDGAEHMYTAAEPPEKGEIVVLDGSDVTVVVDDVDEGPAGEVHIHASRPAA